MTGLPTKLFLRPCGKKRSFSLQPPSQVLTTATSRSHGKIPSWCNSALKGWATDMPVMEARFTGFGTSTNSPALGCGPTRVTSHEFTIETWKRSRPEVSAHLGLHVLQLLCESTDLSVQPLDQVVPGERRRTGLPPPCSVPFLLRVSRKIRDAAKAEVNLERVL
jgi:hypothetical protein